MWDNIYSILTIIEILWLPFGGYLAYRFMKSMTDNKSHIWWFTGSIALSGVVGFVVLSVLKDLTVEVEDQ